MTRRRWRWWLVFCLLLALVGGAILSLAAGARRTDSAYLRFEKAQNAADEIIYISGTGRQAPARFENLPEVAQSAESIGLAPTSTGFTPVVLADNRFGRDINRFKMVAGRLPYRPDETAVGFLFAAARHLHVGSSLTVSAPDAAPQSPATETNFGPRKVTFRVVGVEAAPGEFPPMAYTSEEVIYLPASFLQSPIGREWETASGGVVAVAVRLHGGQQQVPRFLADADRLAGGPVGSATLADQARQVTSSMHLQALALWLMGGLAAIIAVLILMQLFVREVGDDAADHAVLRALGMTSNEMALSAFVRTALIALVGSVVAVGVAVLLSPLFPFGTAGIAEPTPGFSFDALALCLGAAGIFLAFSLIAAVAAWRNSRYAPTMWSQPIVQSPTRRAGMTRQLGRLPLVVATGARMALMSGRGRSAVPVRATITATIVAVVAIASAVTFGSSLRHLLATPRLYGTSYDADVQLNATFGDIRTVLPALRADHEISELAVSNSGIPLVSRKTTFGALAITDLRGSIEPTILDGRLPGGAHEIALGSRTMRSLGAHIGQTIPVAVQGLTRPLAMKVVGTAVLAPVSDTQNLGQGAVLSRRAVPLFSAAMGPRPGGQFHVPPPGDAFVRFAPGISSPSAIAALDSRLGGPSKVLVTAPGEPADVFNFGQVRDLPEILAWLLGAIGAATLAYLLLTSIQRRRRELAVFKTLGFVPRQVSGSILWQATTVAVIAVVVGLPLGVAAGRLAWAAVADGIGVVVVPVVPWVALGLLAGSVVVAANVLAIWPALMAGRISPAAVLRSE